MPSTYTVNLGIEKPATGEQSGTWGDTVNDNSNILDEAINGAVTITLSSAGSSGSPNSITITNGASSTGRNKWIEFGDGGDLGAAAYVQLTPNDAEKICNIRNSLSGNRSIFIFQGNYSASNDLEIAAGTDVVVKFNGGGTGATVVNVYANLKVDGIVATTADINGGTVDGTVIGGASAAALTATTVVANTSVNIAGDGATVTGIKDEDNMASNSATKLATQQSIKAYVDSQVGTVDTLAEILANGNTTGSTDIDVAAAQKVQFRDAAIYINSSVDGQLDIVADTEIQIAATTIDINGAIVASGDISAASLDISGNVDIDGVLNVDAIDIDGAVQLDATLTVGVDDTGYDVKFYGATGGAYMLWDESADDLILAGAGGLVVAGNVDFNGDLDVDGTTNLDVVDIDGAVNMATTALVTGVLTTTAATVFNGGFASNAPSTISSANNLDTLQLISTDADGNAGPNLRFYRNSGSPANNDLLAKVDFEGRNNNSQDVVYASIENYILDVADGTEDGELTFYTMVAGTSRNRLDFTNTQTVFNESSVDVDFRVESDGNANMLFVDGGNNRVGVGTGAPSTDFVVSNSGAEGIEFIAGSTNFIQSFNRSNSAYVPFKIDALTISLQPTSGGVVINDSGNDQDFRVESDAISSAFVLEGSSGDIGVGAYPSNAKVDVERESNYASHTGHGLAIHSSATNAYTSLYMGTDDTIDSSYIQSAGRNTSFTSKSLLLNPNGGNVIINESGVDVDFRVESSSNTHMLFVDGGSNNVYMGSSANIEGGRVQVTSAKTLTANIPYGMLGVNDTTSVAEGVGGAINFTGMYHSNGAITSFGSVEGYKTLSTSGNYDGTLVFKTRVNGGNQIDKLRLNATEAVFNEGGLNTDFRVESDANPHALYLDAGNEVLLIGNNARNSAFVDNVYVGLQIGNPGVDNFGGHMFMSQTADTDEWMDIVACHDNNATGVYFTIHGVRTGDQNRSYAATVRYAYSQTFTLMTVSQQNTIVEYRVTSGHVLQYRFTTAGPYFVNLTVMAAG